MLVSEWYLLPVKTKTNWFTLIVIIKQHADSLKTDYRARFKSFVLVGTAYRNTLSVWIIYHLAFKYSAAHNQWHHFVHYFISLCLILYSWWKPPAKIHNKFWSVNYKNGCDDHSGAQEKYILIFFLIGFG